MERTINYYLVESTDSNTIERIWHYCNYQGQEIAMYKTRVTFGSTGWVVELPDTKIQTAFLLNFGHWVTKISAPYYH